MPDNDVSVVDTVIESQVQATGHPIQSLMDGNGPAWLEGSTGNINEQLLAAFIVDKYQIRKSGKRLENAEGQLLTPDTIKRYIIDEIGPHIPHRTARMLDPIYKIIRYLAPDQTPNLAIKTVSFADLLETEIEEPPFIVDQLLPCGLTIFAAPPKIGKSWLCLALADAVATGSTFWGHSVTQGRVLYYALEDSDYRVKKRLSAIGGHRTKNADAVFRTRLQLDNGLVDQLAAWIEAHTDTRLIILDTLQRIKGAAAYGLDAYAGDYARLAPLQELAIEKKVSIVLVHHFKKLGNVGAVDDVFEMISGSTALFGVSDCAWTLSGKRGDEEMRFHVTGRDVASDEFKVKFDKVSSRWQMLGSAEEIEEQRQIDAYRMNPTVKTIISLVNEFGRWEGKAGELRDEVIKRTGTLPAASEKEMGFKVKDIEELLLLYDSISCRKAQGGRYGRGYTFERVQPTL